MMALMTRMTQPPWNVDVPRLGDAHRLSNWLEAQRARCHDDTFARQFAEACPVPGVEAAAYRHRQMTVGGETLLVGIRFKGCDVAQPFVDLLAWTGEPQSAWIPAIGEEFAAFRPQAVRLGWSRETPPPWPGEVDQHVFAGRVGGPYAGHELVISARDLAWFDDFHREFEQWRGASPLGDEVFPSELADFQDCLDSGHVVVAAHDGRFLGVAACRRLAERAFAGWTIVEEFVVPEAQGRGLGTALQRGLLQRLPTGDVVWGTIHGRNLASQATARRCGRELVETWWFTPLES